MGVQNSPSRLQHDYGEITEMPCFEEGCSGSYGQGLLEVQAPHPILLQHIGHQTCQNKPTLDILSSQNASLSQSLGDPPQSHMVVLYYIVIPFASHLPKCWLQKFHPLTSRFEGSLAGIKTLPDVICFTTKFKGGNMFLTAARPGWLAMHQGKKYHCCMQINVRNKAYCTPPPSLLPLTSFQQLASQPQKRGQSTMIQCVCVCVFRGGGGGGNLLVGAWREHASSLHSGQGEKRADCCARTWFRSILSARYWLRHPWPLCRSRIPSYPLGGHHVAHPSVQLPRSRKDIHPQSPCGFPCPSPCLYCSYQLSFPWLGASCSVQVKFQEFLIRVGEFCMKCAAIAAADMDANV
jgi:hypothetical protein